MNSKELLTEIVNQYNDRWKETPITFKLVDKEHSNDFGVNYIVRIEMWSHGRYRIVAISEIYSAKPGEDAGYGNYYEGLLQQLLLKGVDKTYRDTIESRRRFPKALNEDALKYPLTPSEVVKPTHA